MKTNELWMRKCGGKDEKRRKMFKARKDEVWKGEGDENKIKNENDQKKKREKKNTGKIGIKYAWRNDWRSEHLKKK